MENKSKLDVIKDFFNDVWSNENKEAIKDIFEPDGADPKTADGLSKEGKISPDEFEVFQQVFLSLVGKVRITVDQSVTEGDWLAIRCTVEAVSKKTGRQVSMKGSAWARITGGKIREAYNYLDFLHFFEELEQLPENSMQALMTGNQFSK